MLLPLLRRAPGEPDKPLKRPLSAAQREQQARAWYYGASAYLLPYVNVDDVAEFTELPGTARPRRPDQEAESRSARESLSAEARQVANLVVYTPAEAVDYIYATSQRKLIRSRLAKYLREQLGWPTQKVERAFAELRDYVDALE